MAAELISGKKKIKPEKRRYHWLGSGVYFWENDKERALEWAQEKAGRGEIKTPAVIGAVIELRRCLDLSVRQNVPLLKAAYDSLKALFAKSGAGMISARPSYESTMPLVARQCEFCEATFEVASWEVNRGKGRFCSKPCRNRFAQSQRPNAGADNPAWKGGVWRSNTLIAVKAWARANPEKRRAHKIVSNAIDTGRLTRLACERCGAVPTDAHHEDYSKPLDVVWLCRTCHLKHHRSAA